MADEVSPAKKSRLSREENEQEIQHEERKPIQQKPRTLELDMSKYSTSIQNMTDEELVQIFELGVKVKESFTMSFHEDSSFVKKELEKQMKPIRDEMDKLPVRVEGNMNGIHESVAKSLLASKTEMSNEVNKLKEGLVKDVSAVSNKVLPIGEMEKRIKEDIRGFKDDIRTNNEDFKNDIKTNNEGFKNDIKDLKHDIKTNNEGFKVDLKTFKDDITKKIDGLVTEFQKPVTKGVVGENMALSTLRKNMPNYTFEDVANVTGIKGDIRACSPEDRQIMIEVKYYVKSVQKDKINKFKDDVLSSDDVKVGIMLSMCSAFAMKSKDKFEVNHIDGKYLIYVPNAMQQPDVMVWSVFLANELAGLNVELNDNQAKKLQKLLESIQEKMKSVKTCREKINTLKNAIKGLEESIEPIFGIIQDAGKKLKAILKEGSKQQVYSAASTSTSQLTPSD